MKLLLALLLSICTVQAQFITNTEPNSGESEAATFYNQILFSLGGSSELRARSFDVDPQFSSKYGEIGDIALSTEGSLFLKSDASGDNTTWDKVLTDRDNYPKNGDFESSTILNGWTLGAGCTADSTTDAVTGKQALEITCTAAVLDLSSDAFPASAYKDNFIGISGYLKTSDTDATNDLKHCAVRGDGVEDCVSYPLSSNWERVTPALFGDGGTLKANVKTETAFTGVVIVDNFKSTDDPIRYKEQVAFTDWEDYTPTFDSGLGTVTGIFAKFRRVGDSVEVVGRATSGTVTSAAGGISLPSGLVIDANKANSPGVLGNQGQGWGTYRFNASESEGHIVVSTGTSLTTVYMSGNNNTSLMTSSSASVSTEVGPSSTPFSFFFKVPIEGWSSSDVEATVPVGFSPNECSARISNNGVTATLISQAGGCIESVTRTGLGNVLITFKSGFFVELPAIKVTNGDNGTTLGLANYWENLSTTSVNIRTANDTVAFLDRDFHIQISKQGTDYKFGSLLGSVPVGQVCIVKDVKANGVGGGASVGGYSPQTRDLNTLEGQCSFVSLSSDQMTLAPGRYRFDTKSPVYRTGKSRSYLYNVTDAQENLGDNMITAAADAVMVAATGTHTLEFSTSKTFELRQRSESANSQGLGVQDSVSGTTETYSSVTITRLR